MHEYIEAYNKMEKKLTDQEKISRKIKSMKKYVDFRNILVHMYEEVDIGELHSYLQTNLRDFDDFARYIARHLEKAE